MNDDVDKDVRIEFESNYFVKRFRMSSGVQILNIIFNFDLSMPISTTISITTSVDVNDVVDPEFDNVLIIIILNTFSRLQYLRI